MEFSRLIRSIAGGIGSAGDPGEEAIHNFRLAVKYLRTLLDLAGLMVRNTSRSKELREMLSPAFDAAGKIRTAQMNLALLRKRRAPGTSSFEPALIDDEMRSRKEFASLLAGFDRERFEHLAADAGAAIGGLDNGRVTAAAEKFITARYRIISGILKRVRTPRDLHEIRKNIKSARNTLRLIASCGITARSGIEERIVRTIDQALGRWHDEIVFCRRMKELGAGTPPPGVSRETGAPAAGLCADPRDRLTPLTRDTRRRMAALRRANKIS